MNIKRLLAGSYLTWEEYQKLVYTLQFLRELNAATATGEIKKAWGD